MTSLGLSLQVNDTVEQRVKWAIQNRRLYVFPDAASVGVKPRVIIDEDDEDDIRAHQEKFERKYHEKKSAKELEADGETLLKMYSRLDPKVRADINALLKNSTTPGTRQESPSGLTSEQAVLPEGSAAAASGNAPLNNRLSLPQSEGDLYPDPCNRCIKKGKECREQIPKKSICTNCQKAKEGCSLNDKNSAGKKRPRIDSDSEYVNEENDDDAPDKAAVQTNHLELSTVLREIGTLANETLDQADKKRTRTSLATALSKIQSLANAAVDEHPKRKLRNRGPSAHQAGEIMDG